MSGKTYFGSELGRKAKKSPAMGGSWCFAMTMLQVINRPYVESCQRDVHFHLTLYTEEDAASRVFRRLCKGFCLNHEHS